MKTYIRIAPDVEYFTDYDRFCEAQICCAVAEDGTSLFSHIALWRTSRGMTGPPHWKVVSRKTLCFAAFPVLYDKISTFVQNNIKLKTDI